MKQVPQDRLGSAYLLTVSKGKLLGFTGDTLKVLDHATNNRVSFSPKT